MTHNHNHDDKPQLRSYQRVELRGHMFQSKANQDVYHNMANGTGFELRREPTNKYDSKAIQVLVGGVHVAYVQKPINSSIALWMDRGFTFLGSVTAKYGGNRRAHLATIYPQNPPAIETAADEAAGSTAESGVDQHQGKVTENA